jgi:hypothetical protein
LIDCLDGDRWVRSARGVFEYKRMSERMTDT